jgi:hypothetical protein
MTGSQKTTAVTRIGAEALRIEPKIKVIENGETGGVQIGPVKMLGEEKSVAAFDSNRQGKNVVDLIHFSRINFPLISINREGFLTRKNHIKHAASFNIYGITKLFRSYDESSRTAIPFEDFPGRLDPVKYVQAGDYILQYMILTDLTRDIDKFTNPDNLDGVIEVFEIRESFANTSISDIQTKGIRGSLPNENFYCIGQGASPIDNKFEIKQVRNSIFEDNQDLLYTDTLFGPKQGYTITGSLSFEGIVPDETRIMSPFNESTDDLTLKFKNGLRSFLSGSYTGKIASEDSTPDLGTRFRSSNTGFIQSPNYVIIAEDKFINPGTDSIAFSGMNRN